MLLVPFVALGEKSSTIQPKSLHTYEGESFRVFSKKGMVNAFGQKLGNDANRRSSAMRQRTNADAGVWLSLNV